MLSGFVCVKRLVNGLQRESDKWRTLECAHRKYAKWSPPVLRWMSSSDDGVATTQTKTPSDRKIQSQPPTIRAIKRKRGVAEGFDCFCSIFGRKIAVVAVPKRAADTSRLEPNTYREIVFRGCWSRIVRDYDPCSLDTPASTPRFITLTQSRT
jgi:hypothetical protein